MEKNQNKVDVFGKKITMCHECQTSDGKITLTQTFDFSKVSEARALYFMGADRKIAWRSKSGIKELTTLEAAKFNGITIDCSATVEKVKHVMSAEEVETRELLKAAMSSGKLSMRELKDLILNAQAAKNEQGEVEEPTDDEYSAGETTEK